MQRPRVKYLQGKIKWGWLGWYGIQLGRGDIGEVGRGRVTKPLSAVLKTADFILGEARGHQSLGLHFGNKPLAVV